MLHDRVVDKMFESNKSMVLDKRFAYPDESAKLAKQAKEKGYKVVVIDVDAQLDTSAARVSERDLGTASPTVPFEAVADGYKAVRENRDQVAALKDIDEYVLLKSDTGDKAPKVIYQRTGDATTIHDQKLWDSVRATDPADIARAERWREKLDENSRRRPDGRLAIP